MDEEGETPISRAKKSGHPPLVELLLEEEQTYPTSYSRETALHRAASWGLDEVASRRIAKGENANVQDENGQTPLHMAVRNGHSSTVAVLIDHGADPNVQDKNGMTPLHWAAMTGRPDLAELLLHGGSSVNARDERSGGITPLAIARLMSYNELVDVLSEYGGTW